MSRQRREKPLQLNLGFDEALLRFARADPKEVAQSMEAAEADKTGGGQSMPVTWFKRLSKSDARRETKGSKMPFRFTQAGHDWPWFTDVLFKGIAWETAYGRGGRPCLRSSIPVNVTIMGSSKGTRQMELQYDEARPKNKNAPTVHLKFDPATIADFEAQDLFQRYIIVTRDDKGGYHLTVQAAKPT